METFKVAANSKRVMVIVGHASFTGIDGWLCNKSDLMGKKTQSLNST